MRNPQAERYSKEEWDIAELMTEQLASSSLQSHNSISHPVFHHTTSPFHNTPRSSHSAIQTTQYTTALGNPVAPLNVTQRAFTPLINTPVQQHPIPQQTHLVTKTDQSSYLPNCSEIHTQKGFNNAGTTPVIQGQGHGKENLDPRDLQQRTQLSTPSSQQIHPIDNGRMAPALQNRGCNISCQNQTQVQRLPQTCAIQTPVQKPQEEDSYYNHDYEDKMWHAEKVHNFLSRDNYPTGRQEQATYNKKVKDLTKTDWHLLHYYYPNFIIHPNIFYHRDIMTTRNLREMPETLLKNSYDKFCQTSRNNGRENASKNS